MNKNNRNILSIIFIIALTFSSIQILGAGAKKAPQVKNVIVLIPDGCDGSIVTLARLYKGAPLNVDRILVGAVETWMANSVITDSASAGTAFAAGEKTYDGYISVGPKADGLLTGYVPSTHPYAPLATVLEAAKLQGRSTGLVATSRITHATPAAFASHVDSRDNENEIMEQLVYNEVDVVLGGGFQRLIPKDYTYTPSFGGSWTGSRTDGENLYLTLKEEGYTVVDSKTELAKVTSGRVFGMFASSHMEPSMDRAEFASTQPSIAEMTTKAIELLSKDEDGFFLMVEGSQVDWAGHANDPVYMVTDFLAFDEAVGVALSFAKTHPETLVIAFPDHNTGGLSIGSYTQEKNAVATPYTNLSVEKVVNPLKAMKLTSTGLGKKIGSDITAAKIKSVVEQYWGISLTDAQVNDILAKKTGGLSIEYAISEVVSAAYTAIGWTTHGHCAEDVPLWYYGPAEFRPIGMIDNTKIPQIIGAAFQFDLENVNKSLYNDVESLYPGKWKIAGDAANPILEITLPNGKVAVLPVSKNILNVKGEDVSYTMDGLTIYAPKTGKVYIPLGAKMILKNLSSIFS